MGGKGGSLWKQVTFKLSHERFGLINLLSFARYLIFVFSLRFKVLFHGGHHFVFSLNMFNWVI